MNCINCGKPTIRQGDRLCPHCASQFIRSISAAKAEQGEQTEKTALRPPAETTPDKPSTPKPNPQPAPTYHSQTSQTEHHPKNQKIVNPQVRPVQSPIPPPPPPPAPEKKIELNLFGLLSVVALVVVLIILGYIFGIYPYIEASNYTTEITLALPESEIAHQEAILQIQNIAQYNLEQMTEPIQISRLNRLAGEVAALDYDPTSPRIQLPILPNDDRVAGLQSGDALAYDTILEEQSQQVFLAEKYYDEAVSKHKAIEQIYNQSPNMWVARDLTKLLSPLIDTGDAILDEVDAIIKFQNFFVELTKRTEDMNVAMEQAFLTEDLQVIETTLNESNQEFEAFHETFKLLPKPTSSEKVVEAINELFNIVIEFNNEVASAFETDDLYRMLTATNQFYVDSAKVENRINSDEKEFWEQIPLGELFDTWKARKNSVLDQTHALDSNPLYQVAEKL